VTGKERFAVYPATKGDGRPRLERRRNREASGSGSCTNALSGAAGPHQDSVGCEGTFPHTARRVTRSDLSVDDGFCYARLQQVGELGGGQGPAEEVSLSFRTILGLKIYPLFSRFDALGNQEIDL